MNQNSKILKLAVEKISFVTIQRYLQNRLWVKKQSKREHLAIFFKDYPLATEILLPLDRNFNDYYDLIINALKKISIVENRDINQIINDLLLPPSDVVRFRVDNKRTEFGLITFNEGLSLLDNAKKSLLTTACDIISPTFYHKRMSYKSAQQFIDSCFLGQTERGSFIASIVCPFINETVDDKPTQLSLFNTEEDLINCFTRNVTKRYMKSLLKLKNAIETGNHQLIEDPIQSEMISANFIESIVELGEYGENEEIEIFTSWSFSTPDLMDIPKSLLLKLKPKDEGKDGVFIGKVSKASAESDPSNRNEGEITFNLIGDDEKIIKAKVFLNTNDFSDALDAFDKGLNVKISGKLVPSGKSKTIQNPTFEVLK